MLTKISFVLDGKITELEFGAGELRPATTVLSYLRSLPGHRGVKEGCAEGDCGACTVVIAGVRDGTLRYRAVNSCLVFLPQLHGKQLITVENLKRPSGELHPVQQALVDLHGSQCGYCTPGIVMSMFAISKQGGSAAPDGVRAALSGNLCRCTGYRSILDATSEVRRLRAPDQFTEREPETAALLRAIPHDSLEITTTRQTYSRPATLEEALDIRARRPQSVVINGGTDVALRVSKNHEVFRDVLDLSGIDELTGITEQAGSVHVGAGVTIEELSASQAAGLRPLHSMLAVFGSLQIRNVGTIGGNLGTASPVGDLPPVLMALDVEVLLRSLRGERAVAVSDFFTGYRTTACTADELITGIRIPGLPPQAEVRSYKISRRRDVDIATVSGGFRIGRSNGGFVDDVVLAFGGMAERVKRAGNTERFLRGKMWDRRNVEDAMEIIETDFSPISDVRGSAQLRRIAARNLLLKFWADTTGAGS